MGGGREPEPGESKMGKSLYVSPKMETDREELRKGTWWKKTGGGAQL